MVTDRKDKKICLEIGKMEKIYKKINTEIGYIEAKRNAIYLDSFEQKVNILNLAGEINSTWCEKGCKDYKWYKYRLTVKGVKEYQAINIEDYYKKEIKTESSFSEVLYVSDDKTDLKTILIETYDWVYIIVCKSFEFIITGHR